MTTEIDELDSHRRGAVHRSFQVLRALASEKEGVRVTYLAKKLGLTQATTHRLLQSLILEGMVEQDANNKLYRLSLELFCLGAQAGCMNDLRALVRPVLLRLNARLGDTVLMLVRSGFDAVCIDRVEGEYPIRTFTGDVGGRVALGVGQAGMVILGHLPPAESEEVLNFNLPRIRHFNVYDEVYMRTEMERARQGGCYGKSSGLLEGMAGLAVPVFDRTGLVIGALSVGTHASRLNAERLPIVRDMLLKEAAQLSAQINPFDVTLRRPMLPLQVSSAPLTAAS